MKPSTPKPDPQPGNAPATPAPSSAESAPGESKLPRALAIVGPTAAGKSKLGLACARRFGHSILSCDSVQVFRGLDIGSAKASLAERSELPHYGVDCVAPDESFSAGDYVRLALPLVSRERCIIVGGTGLYLRSLAMTQTQALARVDTDPSAKEARVRFDAAWMQREAQEAGAAHAALQGVDERSAQEIHPRNVVRVLRALWLCERLGRPISELRREDPPRARVALFVVVLDPGQELLSSAIARRCQTMLDQGWLDELQGLSSQGYDPSLPALSSMGYRQLFAHLRGDMTLQEAKASIIHDTTQYARRQRTYFRHQLPKGPTRWISDPSQFPWDEVAAFLQ